jgi:hypothetical protein
MAGGDASVSLDLNAQQLYQELQNVQTHFAQFAAKATQGGEEASKGFVKGFSSGGLGSLGQNLAGAVAALGIGHEIKDVIEYGAKIEQLHLKFGVGVEDLQRFGNAAEKQFGISHETLAKFFGFLEVNQAKALGGNRGMIDAFQGLGISLDDLKTKSVVTQGFLQQLGEGGLNAAEFKKIGGKGALEVRDFIAAIGDGTVEFGDAISAIDIQKLYEANKIFKELHERVTILVGTGLGVFFEGVEAAAGGLAGRIDALIIGLKGIADASAALQAGQAKGGAQGFLEGLNPFGALKTDNVKNALDILDKSRNDQKSAVEGGNEGAADEILERRAKLNENANKYRDLSRAGLDKDSDVGETDDQGRPLKKAAAESQQEKEEKLGDKLEQKEEERYLKSVGYEERIAELKSKAAEELTASHESRDYDDRTEAAIEYYDTLKDIDTVEKEHLADIAKEGQQRKTAVETAAREKQTADKKAEHDKERALNPAGLSLKDIAENPLIGVDSKPIAQEALREEAAARRSQLQGNLGEATEHHNRAEELKKSLGLPNDIDKEKHFSDALDKSETLKAIRDNTKDMAANK